MQVFSTAMQLPARAVPDIGQNFAQRNAIAPETIRDQRQRLTLAINRDVAARLGLAAARIDSVLYDAFRKHAPGRRLPMRAPAETKT